MPLLPPGLKSSPLGINAAFTIGLGLGGKRQDPYQGFNFLVEIEGLLTGGFTEVSGLESEIEYDEIEEGGLNHKRALPVRVKHAPLILKHGLTDIDTLWNWYEAASRGVIRRKNGTILLLDRQDYPVMWWNFRNGFPVKWRGPELNAADNAVAFETIELIHEGLSRPPLLGSAAPYSRAGLQFAGVKLPNRTGS